MFKERLISSSQFLFFNLRKKWPFQNDRAERCSGILSSLTRALVLFFPSYRCHIIRFKLLTRSFLSYTKRVTSSFSNRSWCLNDPPVLAHAPTLPPRNRGKLPGEIINGDQQCREAFSEDFKHASREKLRVRIMMMSVNDGSWFQ